MDLHIPFSLHLIFFSVFLLDRTSFSMSLIHSLCTDFINLVQSYFGPTGDLLLICKSLCSAFLIFPENHSEENTPSFFTSYTKMRLSILSSITIGLYLFVSTLMVLVGHYYFSFLKHSSPCCTSALTHFSKYFFLHRYSLQDIICLNLTSKFYLSYLTLSFTFPPLTAEKLLEHLNPLFVVW